MLSIKDWELIHCNNVLNEKEVDSRLINWWIDKAEEKLNEVVNTQLGQHEISQIIIKECLLEIKEIYESLVEEARDKDNANLVFINLLVEREEYYYERDWEKFQGVLNSLPNKLLTWLILFNNKLWLSWRK